MGGIKEKILAAKSAGIKKVIMPKKNEKNLEEILNSVKKSIEFQFVESIDDFIHDVLKRKIEKKTKSKE